MAGSRITRPAWKAMDRLLPEPRVCQTTPMRRSPGMSLGMTMLDRHTVDQQSMHSTISG